MADYAKSLFPAFSGKGMYVYTVDQVVKLFKGTPQDAA